MVEMSGPDFPAVKVLAWIITVSVYTNVKGDGEPDVPLGNVDQAPEDGERMKAFFRNVIGVPESDIVESKEPSWIQINRDKDDI